MVELDDEKVFYAFDKTLEPAMVVPSGTTVRVRTKDCFGNQIQKPEDELDGIDWDHTNPATGPIFVEGAVPGGALMVSIDAIEFDNKSVSCTGENEGVCGDRFQAWSTQVCEIDGDELVWDERLRIPLRPMIGVIGVAPESDPINWRHAGQPWRQYGQHGYHGRGYPLLPRLRRWGAFWMRGYACRYGRWRDQRLWRRGSWVGYGYADGDAELKLVDPLIENATHFGVIASAETLDARQIGLCTRWWISSATVTAEDPDKVVMLLSLVGDVQVCQMVDPEKTIRFMVPKYVLDSLGFKL